MPVPSPRSVRLPRVASALGLCASAAVAALATGAARADDAPGSAPPVGRFFDTYDVDADGRVTRDEFKGDAELFDLLDRDHDGCITVAEMGPPADYKPRPLPPPREEPMGPGRGGQLAERMERMRKQIAEMDTDKDGRVSKEEWKGKAPFDRVDANKDGFVTIEDLRPAGRAGGMSPQDVARRLKEADKDGDGKLSKEEWPGPADRFQALDKDGDGFVTTEEMSAAMAGGGPDAGPVIRFKRYDKNGDGKITRDEFAGSDETFKALDKDGDGSISEAEARASMGRKPGKEGTPSSPEPKKDPAPGTMPAPEGDGEMDGPMAPPRGDGAGAPPARPALGALFSVLDKNKDGKISREEFPGTDDEWRALDRDRNGWVTPDEAANR